MGVVARNYGEVGTGIFTLALTYIAFFYIISDFGFNAHILGKLQEKSNISEVLWRKLLGVRILWSLFLMIVALTVVFFLPSATFPYEFKAAVFLGAIIIFFYSLNTTAQSLFQARLKYELGAFPVFISAPLGVLTIILMAELRLPIQMMVLGYVVSWIIYGTSTYLLTSKLIQKIIPIFDIRFTKSLFIGAFPLALTLILNTAYFRADSFILSFYHSPSDVGLYNIAYQVFQAVLVLPTFIMNSFYPLMLQSLKLGTDKFTYQTRLMSLSLIFFSLTLSLAIYAISPFIIKLITHSGFGGSIDSLQILSFGFPAYFLSALALWVMVARRRYKNMVVIYTIGLLVNLLLNFALIPKYSYIGAALVTVASEYLILILQIVSLRKWRN